MIQPFETASISAFSLLLQINEKALQLSKIFEYISRRQFKNSCYVFVYMNRLFLFLDVIPVVYPGELYSGKQNQL